MSFRHLWILRKKPQFFVEIPAFFQKIHGTFILSKNFIIFLHGNSLNIINIFVNKTQGSEKTSKFWRLKVPHFMSPPKKSGTKN